MTLKMNKTNTVPALALQTLPPFLGFLFFYLHSNIPHSLLSGAWYDRPLDDTPSAINKRLNYKPLSFFQTDIDLSGEVKPLTGPNITDQFLQHLEATDSDAFAYLTLYPFKGYDAVTDAQLKDISDRILRLIQRGRKVFIRYAPEVSV
jgi:hypothetical protein